MSLLERIEALISLSDDAPGFLQQGRFLSTLFETTKALGVTNHTTELNLVLGDLAPVAGQSDHWIAFLKPFKTSVNANVHLWLGSDSGNMDTTELGPMFADDWSPRLSLTLNSDSLVHATAFRNLAKLDLDVKNGPVELAFWEHLSKLSETLETLVLQSRDTIPGARLSVPITLPNLKRIDATFQFVSFLIRFAQEGSKDAEA